MAQNRLNALNTSNFLSSLLTFRLSFVFFFIDYNYDSTSIRKRFDNCSGYQHMNAVLTSTTRTLRSRDRTTWLRRVSRRRTASRSTWYRCVWSAASQSDADDRACDCWSPDRMGRPVRAGPPDSTSARSSSSLSLSLSLVLAAASYHNITDPTSSPLCRKCNSAPHTLEHWLHWFPAAANQRLRFFPTTHLSLPVLRSD